MTMGDNENEIYNGGNNIGNSNNNFCVKNKRSNSGDYSSSDSDNNINRSS